VDRRHFLAAALAASSAPLFAQALPELMAAAGKRRVVIVGGGWGGLSAARRLREFAPELEVVVLERNAVFRSCPLSNRWLVGLLPEERLVHDYKAAANAYGYRFVQAEVTAVDRERRRVVTPLGTVAYDWLILAVGIRHDYSAWLGGDRAAIDHARKHYPCAFTPSGDEARALKAKLDAFAGGDLVMTVPPSPYRCPPAPYERAGMIGWLLKSRRIKGRLIVIDPNTILPAFARVFAEQYRDQILHVPHATVKEFDPFRKTIATDFDEFRFDDAIVMAPQQAGDLVWQAGLVGRDADGKPSGWAAHDPVHLHAVDDERIFLIGDLMGWVSPLFGPYPKTGQIASRLGRIAAREIAARARGAAPERLLPDSTCHIYTSIEPMEALRLEASYRFRGDGLIVQSGKQSADPQPRDEDVQWANAMFGEFLAPR
jgi:NADPH-dependent 2,4-dienoyl-CoA reductase/sulfur reductase-like enzyme